MKHIITTHVLENGDWEITQYDDETGIIEIVTATGDPRFKQLQAELGVQFD